MLAKVNSLQPTGAGGWGNGYHCAIIILDIGNHSNLVLPTWKEAGQANFGRLFRLTYQYHLLWLFFLTFDILARVLVEGDVLRVDDGARGLVVPAGIVSKWDPVIRVFSEISISIFGAMSKG